MRPDDDPWTWRDTPVDPQTDVSTHPTGSGEIGWLLTDMLDLVRSLLHADTATVLLLDASTTVLECVAALGNADAVHQRFRVPVGRGFAGSIAESRRPATIRVVDEHNVVNPHIRHRGITSLLGVPLVHDDQLLGVIHVGSITQREFSDDEVAILARAAQTVSHMIATHSAEAENALASALQLTLIPATPPAVPGLDLGARYVPAEGNLGGDWHDVFRLPNGKVGLVIGDVIGHGFDAAVIMGRLRSALRSYALEHDDPSEVLRLLDAKIHYFEAGAMATVLYGVTEPPFVHVRISSAGHIAPLLAVEGGTTEQLEIAPDLPLGVDLSMARTTHEVGLPPSSAICMFTDGLVERRPPHDAVAGAQDQIRDGVDRVIAAFDVRGADECCTRVLETALADVDVLEDDVALLVARPVRSTRAR